MSGFRLAGLLRVRRTQEKLVAADAARAAGAARAATQLHAEARAVLGAHELSDRGAAGWAGAVAARSALRVSLLQAQAEAELAAGGAREAAGVLAAARARTKALEQLEARHAAEVARAALKAEQHRVDDLRRAPSTDGRHEHDDEGDDE
ncbi:hypothetical protein [Pseudokineococcus sp. 1T1Z-3]|uniref:hypothetical protein n=1 Tax=Pseudokineococcus sp. 1T1Z-3 TaxID=3132745 RepID=UPI00309F2AD7